MWLLTFAILSLVIGADLRQRGRELCYLGVSDSILDDIGHHAAAAGGWISFLGGVCLNIAVWQLF
jgi:hypothetical protein